MLTRSHRQRTGLNPALQAWRCYSARIAEVNRRGSQIVVEGGGPGRAMVSPGEARVLGRPKRLAGLAEGTPGW